MSAIILSSPVRGTIHSKGWVRPAGNRDFKVTAYFGPSKVTAEPKVVWPGGCGIAAGTYPLFHQGLDISDGGCGTAILAMAAGVVEEARVDASGNRRVIVRHGTRWRSWHSHLADEVVSVGQAVAAGQLLGHIGDSGNATGCHDHVALEDLSFGIVVASKNGAIWHNKFVDPWPHLAQNVTVRAKGPGIRIRSTAGSGSTPGPIFAATRDDGHIYRADGTEIGLTAAMAKWGGRVSGASYTTEPVAGQPVSGTTWERIYLDGAFRFIASPLAIRSI